MNTYDRGSLYYNAYQYWAACPSKYNYVGVLYSKEQSQWSSTVYRSVSGESAKKNLRANTRGYYNKNIGTLLTRDQFNAFRTMIKNNSIPENFKIEDIMSTSLTVTDQRTNVKGKIVHLVWNQTLGQVAWADLTSEACVAKATELARANPTHEFVICSPVQRVFQPINITVEAYKPEVVEG